ncbi:hypothetical protein B0H11DRAFT_2243300 [Mycena galericulata]|nr:hypothetical protein B0H11DRAFT_2243300 [Mycena galericulata]
MQTRAIESCAGPRAQPLPDIPEDDFSDSERAVTPSDDGAARGERLSSPLTPLPPSGRQPLVIKTYLSRDKNRLRTNTAQDAKLSAQKATAAREKAREQVHPAVRRSRRLRRGRLGDSSDHGVWRAEQVLRAGYITHPWMNPMPRPLVDRNDYIMAVVAGGPKKEGKWWSLMMKAAERDIARLYRNGNFSHLGEGESHVRFGLGFGDGWEGPYEIDNFAVPPLSAIQNEIQYIRKTEAMQAISAYQNHIYEQFFPKNYADVGARMNQLVDRRIVAPPFDHSVFTTCEISFCDAPRPTSKNYDSLFYGMELITSIGDYEGGGIIFSDDEGVLPLLSGSTVAFPAGTKRYTFESVAPHETRFLIRQFCHAGIMRWVDKGGRSDMEFERNASAADKAAWEAYRLTRGNTSAKLFSKLGDVYVF